MTSAHVHTTGLSQELMLECEDISFSECCITVFFSYYHIGKIILLANSVYFSSSLFDELYIFSYTYKRRLYIYYLFVTMSYSIVNLCAYDKRSIKSVLTYLFTLSLT